MRKETARNELTSSGRSPSTRLRDGRTVGRKDKGQRDGRTMGRMMDEQDR